MPSEAKPLLTAQTEKPNHYKYLKEFRVEQCPSFLQHKCTQHRPFTCFHWHFNNQRRRRPVRKRDGSFNYSADNYCTKYNETSGVCEDGDECPYLHRTAGDTERRYHLRYYKTCMCVHDTDARGFCVKNGPHCAFAHGNSDLRPPVYDIKEIQALENSESEANGGSNGGPNVLDKERNLITEDPKWQDTNYVLSSYKTEACKRPPRLCRQGYACPQYHNSKDKRRSPRKHKYRSTPCPNVKHGEEWGEPSNCDAGDTCAYCHTRTEQQFHPEIYKSTKCNDVQQAGYCPRGFFCAFAHVEPEEMSLARELGGPLDCGPNFADILSSALPPDKKSSESSQNGSGEASESASTSSLGSSGGARAPGAPLAVSGTSMIPSSTHMTPLASHANLTQSTLAQLAGMSSSNNLLDYRSDLVSNDTHVEHKPTMVAWPHHNTSQTSTNAQTPGPVQPQTFDTTILTTVVGNALEDMHLDDPLQLVASLDRDLSDGESGRGLLPGAGGGSPMGSSFLRYRSETHEMSEISRLRDEIQVSRAAAAHWDERITQARTACDAWRRESDEARHKANMAERQRDEALALVTTLRRELDARANAPPAPPRDLRLLSIPALKVHKERLHSELEEIEKQSCDDLSVDVSERSSHDRRKTVLYLETATKCMACEEHNRSVTLAPCNHYVLCEGCAATQKECPYCQTPVTPSN